MKQIYYKGQLIPFEDWDFTWRRPKSEVKIQSRVTRILDTEEIVVTEDAVEETTEE